MDDLETIVRLNRRLLPFRARQNIEIALYSYALGAHLKMLQQRGNAEAVRNFAKLAIDRDFHGTRAAGNLIRRFLIRWLA